MLDVLESSRGRVEIIKEFFCFLCTNPCSQLLETTVLCLPLNNNIKVSEENQKMQKFALVTYCYHKNCYRRRLLNVFIIKLTLKQKTLTEKCWCIKGNQREKNEK
jgi:hypothetical protein